MKKLKLEIIGLSYSQTQSGAYALVLGEEKGKQIGEEIGEKKGIIKVALSMIQKGLDNQTIAEFTNLTPEEIDKLRRQ